ncbi:hypothetical protein AAG570_000496 [Ranatra chinensis]|uniref:Uncharacterized protein n=1 Tax=Ranatra chinensis TaxID=642074 RepID=A0ABD0YX80_9HEMI
MHKHHRIGALEKNGLKFVGDQQQQPKAKEGEDNAKSPAEQVPTSGNDALPAAPPASVFNKPRAPPKIRPPVPLNERHKYEYTTKPGQQAASAQPYTPSAGGKDRARGRDHQEDDLDYYDEDELEDEEEEDYEEEPPKKARKDFEATPGRGKGSSRRRGGQQSRKRPPPSRYDDDDMYDDEPERPKQRKGQHSRRTEEEYPRNRNRGLRKGYRDEDDDEMPHERYSGRGNNRRPHQQSMRSSQRSHRRPYYDEADSEEYEYYDDEEDADQYKTQRGKNGHKQSDKRLTVPSSRNKNRNRNEDDRPSPRTTSTTPAPLTTTTPSNVKSQKAKNKDIVEDKSLEDYYDEQEESTSNGKTNNNRDDHPTTTAKNRPNIPVKYTFKPRQEVTPTILAHRSSTVTSSTTHLTTPTPATVPETTRTEPPKRFRMPIEIKLKMKPVLNGRSKVAASDAQEKTSSEKLESSAEVSQRPQQEVEVTTRYSAPVRQLINRRLVRPSTVSSEEDEQAPASSPPQPAQQKGVSFHTRRPSGQSEEAPQSNQQGAVLRRPIKVVVDQPRKYPAEFAIKPDYSSIEQPRGFANGRRPPPIALTTEAQELPTQTGTGLNYRNPFKPLETDLEDEEKSVEQPRTENGPPLGFNYRRPYKTKEPEETRNSQSQEDFETERPQILTRRPFKPKVAEQQDNNPKPALEEPTRAPQVQESRRPLQRLPEPIADIPTGPAQDTSGFRKQEIANPPRTYAFFNTRPKRPPTEERDQIFPPQRPKLIEVTAPGPSAPSEDSTIRPGIVQQQQQNYNNGFHGLDFADEEYDVTLNDALQPSTLHPTQSLLGGSSEIQSFQPRVKTRGFQSAITHPSYTNRGSATYLIPSASQQFYSKVQQEAPPDSIPQGTILDTREYEAIVVPAPRFNQPRFKQRTRPREWFW